MSSNGTEANLSIRDQQVVRDQRETRREIVEALRVDMTVRNPDELSDQLGQLEADLFAKREQVEVLWLDIGRIVSHITDKKLYKQGLDEDGNHFRTAKAYFADLDRRFKERGYHLGRTTVYQFAVDYKLFIEGDSGVRLSPEQAVTLGKSNLEELSRGVRRLQKEGKADEAVALVSEVVAASDAMGGLPLGVVQQAVDDNTDRVMKGLAVEFQPGVFGRKIKSLTLWWGGVPIDVLRMEITPEQEEWLCRRLGIRPREQNS